MKRTPNCERENKCAERKWKRPSAVQGMGEVFNVFDLHPAVCERTVVPIQIVFDKHADKYLLFVHLFILAINFRHEIENDFQIYCIYV